MFKRLRHKLTVLYAGLFCIALMLIGATAYGVIADATHRLARQQLTNSQHIFQRGAELRLALLQEASRSGAAAAVVQQAASSRDTSAMRAALAGLRGGNAADSAFWVTPEGLIVGDDTLGQTSVPAGLQRALATGRPLAGSMTFADTLHFAAATPIAGGHGWVIVSATVDGGELRVLEEVSTLPLRSTLVRRVGMQWVDGEGDGDPVIAAVLDANINAPEVRTDVVQTEDGRALALTAPLTSIDGTRAALVLRYQLSGALSPYRTLFSTLFAIGLVGLALLIAGTWFLASGITKPLSTLEVAARQLQQGVFETVEVATKDELSRLAESFNAMTGAIKERERKITQLAFQDAETRLPNRLALERRLAGAQRPERLYLAAIGVNRFAHVRGAIGYGLAGVLVRTLGQRLAQLVPNAPMARLSTDVLGVAILADSDSDVSKRISVLVAALEQPLSIDGHDIDVHVTIGVAQPRAKDERPGAMIERASVALDQARANRAKMGLFDEAAYGDPARNLSLMSEMRRALENGEMQLVHQPKYDFRSGRIESVECLVRWRHPTRGMISPDLFVPMAEETGHIRALTEWVLQEALKEQARFAAAGHPLALSVNISARLLTDPDFAREAIEVLRAAPAKLGFEITETAIVEDPTVAMRNIQRFAAAGATIAIDDYGSGLSSLAYLKQLPAQELKIDKMFVQNMTTNERDALLVRSTIDLAHGLGMSVTVEGIETPGAFSMLASMRCDMAQGFIISRPVPAEELLALLSDEKRLRFYQQSAAAGRVSAPTPVALPGKSA